MSAHEEDSTSPRPGVEDPEDVVLDVEGKATGDDASQASAGGAEDVDLKEATSAAQDAHKTGDAEASKLIHDQKAAAHAHAEKHGGAGADFVKSIVFGGLDGIITTFAIVAAVAGANLDPEVVILMGFSNVLADGISMGLGDYLSSKAENDYILHERKREAWEYDNYPEGEIAEMIDIYVSKGFSREDATTIITTYTSKPEYRDLFIDHMMVEELGHQVPDEDDNPAMDGLVTFLSFLFFGSIPMWFYVAFVGAGYDEADVMFAVACVATVITMFSLGAFKAKITKQPMMKAGLLMTLNGSLAAGSAYLLGWALEEAMGVSSSVA
jgi:DNA damage-binding protein 1